MQLITAPAVDPIGNSTRGPTSIYLIRHGDYDHRRCAPDGSVDHGLTETGRRQVFLLRDRLLRTREIKADVLFCSNLRRARETAEIIAPALGCAPKPLDSLREWDNGNDLIGLAAFMNRWHALPHADRPSHRTARGFESAIDFGQRVREELDRLVASHEGGTLVLVVHAGVIEAAFGYFVRLPHHHFVGTYPAAAHTSITLWRQSFERREWVQQFANDATHLAEAR